MRLPQKLGLTLCLALVLGLWGFVPPAQADSKVIVVNETGYHLEQVKYVQELGEVKKLTSATSQMAQGGSHTFRIRTPGMYRCYITFKRDGRQVYAKGKVNQVEDRGTYRLTLKKVVVKEGGTSINYINQGEFDAIK